LNKLTQVSDPFCITAKDKRLFIEAKLRLARTDPVPGGMLCTLLQPALLRGIFTKNLLQIPS